MTGPYEQGLINIAEGGVPFDIPIVSDLVAKLVDLRDVVDAAAQQPGIEGESANTATARFQAARETISAQISYLENALQSALTSANGIRDDARERLANLPSGQLSSGQESAVRTAAAGTTLIFGPLALLAGEGAVQAFNGQLSQQREAQAKRDFETVSSSLQGLNPPSPPSATFAAQGGTGKFEKTDESPAVPSGRSPSGDRPHSGGGSTNDSPTFIPRGYDPADPVHTTPTPEHLIPRPDTPRGRGIDLGQVPPHYTPPTPDGSISGIGTLPGRVSGPGLIGGSFPGGISGGGAGLSAGLIAGGGGAAALSRLSSGAGSSAAAAGRTISGSGGLLGRGGAAATGAGLGGRAGTGSLGGGAATGTSTSGTGANAAAAGSRGATASAGAAAPGGGTAGGTGGRGAAGSGSGSRSDRRDERRGLGGPIAPRLDDDEETAPRSENAAAGSRDV